jgi:site-specific DNA recombinase
MGWASYKEDIVSRYNGTSIVRNRFKREVHCTPVPPAVKEPRSGMRKIVENSNMSKLKDFVVPIARPLPVIHGASFVSVTQQFNTTTSMGRLTLNVLLSFAQFEREVTGERIRDKIAASKRKGMWMGGTTPFGYDAKDRRLVVNEAEAETVRSIYRRYLELGCVSALTVDLRDQGIVSKVKVSRRGNTHGGQPFGRGALYHLLQNQIYLGKVVHRGEAHAGQHSAIVSPDLWNHVQHRLAANRVERRQPRATGGPQLLTGRLWDERGNLMVPTHVRKANGQRYRYYVSQPLTAGGKQDGDAVSRIPAGAIEELVSGELQRRLPEIEARRWDTANPKERAEILERLVGSVIIRVTEVEIRLTNQGAKGLVPRGGASAAVFSVPVQLKPGAGGTTIVTLDGHAPRTTRIDKALVRAIARAHHWRELLESGEARTAYDLARHEACRVSYVQRHLPLAFLSPKLVELIIDGKQPSWCVLSELVERPRADNWSSYNGGG